ncbi:MAG: isoleucine--tRNA ligase [Bacteroidetes bacterium]|jgi:isoleucyl-tRNA synthetase|nr:isoleucine--tRNA ligase [Bacteroidota bacterium]MBT6685390.1 isoleucine--tRNA ligase [Bacteroidota bacterium]MBT7145030.1 isoleucine--tRNA ligase [Bacteroidota bacterium]MBT7492715.1 isoleucine--tRNA ligase [Bacteroidota bacterium]
MAKKFPVYKQLDLSQINKDILKIWEENNTFEKSISSREGQKSFVFYEGPPSANGKPGIHHVMARSIKDIFCRYKTMQGFHVKRKAGWDTHGLPIELSVEKTLGITKEDIGKKISIEDYNKACRKDVMKYTDLWEELTLIMGYWVNMDDPYITYDNRYIETLWYLLKKLYEKGYLYKGHSIQPYSPAAGTGLSTHELNLPGCYKDVKDTTCVAQFKIVRNQDSEFLYDNSNDDVYFLAWTTTPWTLPSNTALAVGPKIDYVKVKTYNQYTGKQISVILAEDLFTQHFSKKNKDLKLEDYNTGDKKIPYEIISEHIGKDFNGIRYEQILKFHQPTDGDAFRVVLGDFVTTEDGTGIVHIAPSFGADDYRVAAQNGIGSLTLVDKQGKFIDGCEEISGRFVKNSYDENLTEADPTVDVDIVVRLKKENKAFNIEKHEHNYPHCWRTDKPILYYPLDSWFIKTTAVRDRMIELNNTINWKPPATGSGRFGKWLENLVDWNLSRSRYWGTPLPIWVSEDKEEKICIGSVEELKKEIDKSVEAGFMHKNPISEFEVGDNSEDNYNKIDLHKPFVDDVVLVSPTGKKMFREKDLIDVWFDSGAMPYAQLHYPFEHKDDFEQFFPSDFIAEGVDQTRGWFFTLHAIAVMLFDSVSFKNIISNGLVLDKDGNKMSKRLGNAVDPFKTIEKYGSDPVRWYMISNSQPWDNLKFDISGIDEVRRKFFGTLYNTYSFFALYANVDGFEYNEPNIVINQRPELDRWILSVLNSLIKEVEYCYENYFPTKAARAIQNFVSENLSNWFVRLSRKRYWGGEYSTDKISAYQTLYTCLEAVAQLAAPISPFYTEQLFLALNSVSNSHSETSVHLSYFPKYNEKYIDKDLEAKMEIAQKICSMVLSLRRKVNIKVRQPLSQIMIPILDEKHVEKINAIEKIILSEVNVKSIKLITDVTGIIVKKVKPNFKKLGRRFGKLMKQLASIINHLSQEDILKIEKEGKYRFFIDDEPYEVMLDELDIISEDVPGWLVTSEGKLTIALDINISQELKEEGIARELINRIQNFRKDSGFDVTDKITIEIQKNEVINSVIENYSDYIKTQTLSLNILLKDEVDLADAKFIEIDDKISTIVNINKI